MHLQQLRYAPAQFSLLVRAGIQGELRPGPDRERAARLPFRAEEMTARDRKGGPPRALARLPVADRIEALYRIARALARIGYHWRNQGGLHWRAALAAAAGKKGRARLLELLSPRPRPRP